MRSNSAHMATGGFTLLEVAISIGLIAFLLTAMILGIAFIQEQSRLLGWKSEALSETSNLTMTVSNLIKNSYGISYEGSDLASDLWKISVYDDKFERNRTEIYVERDTVKDISRIMIRRNGWDPYALHSNTLYVNSLKIRTSPDPRANPSSLDDQPWITFDIETRKRSLMEYAVDDKYYNDREKVPISLKTTEVLRNYTPSSLKN